MAVQRQQSFRFLTISIINMQVINHPTAFAIHKFDKAQGYEFLYQLSVQGKNLTEFFSEDDSKRYFAKMMTKLFSAAQAGHESAKDKLVEIANTERGKQYLDEDCSFDDKEWLSKQNHCRKMTREDFQRQMHKKLDQAINGYVIKLPKISSQERDQLLDQALDYLLDGRNSDTAIAIYSAFLACQDIVGESSLTEAQACINFFLDNTNSEYQQQFQTVLEKAAYSGRVGAQFILAQLHVEQIHLTKPWITRDPAIAARWYRKAADNGHERSSDLLAGRGIPFTNFERAVLCIATNDMDSNEGDSFKKGFSIVSRLVVDDNDPTIQRIIQEGTNRQDELPSPFSCAVATAAHVIIGEYVRNPKKSLEWSSVIQWFKFTDLSGTRDSNLGCDYSKVGIAFLTKIVQSKGEIDDNFRSLAAYNLAYVYCFRQNLTIASDYFWLSQKLNIGELNADMKLLKTKLCDLTNNPSSFSLNEMKQQYFDSGFIWKDQDKLCAIMERYLLDAIKDPAKSTEYEAELRTSHGREWLRHRSDQGDPMAASTLSDIYAEMGQREKSIHYQKLAKKLEGLIS